MEKKKVVLIIEDDEILLRALYLKFQNAGYTLSSATDGESGLKVAQRVTPDLILLDLILPKMDGFDVLKFLKADPNTQDIPVVVLSNLGDDVDIKKAKDLGALDYYIKANTKLEHLQEKVVKLLS